MTYILRVLLAIDQLINTVCGGYPDETLSYRAALANQDGVAWGCVLCRMIEWFIPGHCDLRKVSKAERLSRGGSYAEAHGITPEVYFHHDWENKA